MDSVRTGPTIAAVTLLGFGLGGFIDAIVFHMLLQWHQMISNILPPDTSMKKNINMFWDGVFESFTFIMTFIGLLMFWDNFKNSKLVKSDNIFWGSLLFGWGLFNVFDSLIDHYLFKFHNVRENVSNPEVYNIVFLISAILFMIVGWFIINKGRKKHLMIK